MSRYARTQVTARRSVPPGLRLALLAVLVMAATGAGAALAAAGPAGTTAEAGWTPLLVIEVVLTVLCMVGSTAFSYAEAGLVACQSLSSDGSPSRRRSRARAVEELIESGLDDAVAFGYHGDAAQPRGSHLAWDTSPSYSWGPPTTFTPPSGFGSGVAPVRDRQTYASTILTARPSPPCVGWSPLWAACRSGWFSAPSRARGRAAHPGLRRRPYRARGSPRMSSVAPRHSREHDVIDEAEAEMFDPIVSIGSARAEIMVPRVDIVIVDASVGRRARRSSRIGQVTHRRPRGRR